MNTTSIISLIELAANVILAAIPITTAFAPLVAALEAGINPLITAINAGSTTTTDVMAGYATLIALITTLKAQTNLDPTVLAKLNEYLTAAENGTQAALAVAATGYNASALTPVIAIT